MLLELSESILGSASSAFAFIGNSSLRQPEFIGATRTFIPAPLACHSPKELRKKKPYNGPQEERMKNKGTINALVP